MNSSRFFGLLSRFFSATHAIGLANALKIFWLGHLPGLRLRLRLPNRSVFCFDSKIDQGVLEHFYKLGYVIVDTPECVASRIIDAGANIGDETARFRVHLPEAVIAAIEPADRNFELLRVNFGSDPNVKLFHGGLWPKTTKLHVIPGDCTQAFTVREIGADNAATPNTVQAWSVPTVMETMGWTEIDILKLDIEGAEYEVFSQEIDDWIAKVRCIIFEVADHDRAGMTQKIFESLGSQRFNATICGENLILIRNDVPWQVLRVLGFRPEPHAG